MKTIIIILLALASGLSDSIPTGQGMANPIACFCPNTTIGNSQIRVTSFEIQYAPSKPNVIFEWHDYECGIHIKGIFCTDNVNKKYSGDKYFPINYR